jgi:TPR repeat protein
MTNLGYAYNGGVGVKEDNAQAETWYLRAADAGDEIAMWNLAVAYHDGTLGARRHDAAAKYFIAAAEAGNARARETLLGDTVRGLSVETRREIQRLLAERGYYSGGIDGAIGPGTRAAIEAFLEK